MYIKILIGITVSHCHKEGRTSKLALPFHLVLESYQLNICVHFYALNFSKNIIQQESGQKTAVGVTRGLQHMTFKGTLKDLELVLLKMGRAGRKDITNI